jgi:hypothetical protein
MNRHPRGGFPGDASNKGLTGPRIRRINHISASSAKYMILLRTELSFSYE